ncbi:MAG: glycosyltransferase family 4 protein [Candidatus Helarchaeales archaeon]
MIKVLLFTIYHHPSAGGISSYMECMKNGLESKGVQAEIISFNSLNFFTRIFLMIFHAANRISCRFFYPLYLFFLKMAFIIFFIKNREKFSSHSIIHVQDPVSALIIDNLKFMDRKRKVLTVHGFLTPETLQRFNSNSSFLKRILQNLEKKAFNSVQYIICVERNRKKYVNELAPSVNQVSILHNFVDVTEFQKAPASFFNEQLPSFRYKVLNPKRMVGTSDLITFIEAAKYCWNHRKDIAFLMTGHGHLKRKLHDYIQAKKIPNIYILNPISHDLMPKVYNSVDIIVITSQKSKIFAEGISMAMLEAMACEKPVIASATGGSLKVITDGDDGFLFPPGNPEKLAEKILLLIENTALREKIGKNARKKIIENHEKEKMIEKLLRIYSKMKNQTG